ncbi:MAG: hypothetical protein ACRC33_23395 [Gemmataceae bacterium]
MHISIPDHLNDWVARQATEAGFARPADFVALLLERERYLSERGADGFLRSAMADEGADPLSIAEADLRRRRGEVEARVLEALDSPAAPMAGGDWERLRRAAGAAGEAR